jgi:hypothetical protein
VTKLKEQISIYAGEDICGWDFECPSCDPVAKLKRAVPPSCPPTVNDDPGDPTNAHEIPTSVSIAYPVSPFCLRTVPAGKQMLPESGISFRFGLTKTILNRLGNKDLDAVRDPRRAEAGSQLQAVTHNGRAETRCAPMAVLHQEHVPPLLPQQRPALLHR